MPLQLVEPRRLYRQIADQIAGLIAAGEFPPGSRLPAERELAAKLGVSRASVREAIISLEIGGLVEVRVGTGIFVTAKQRPEVDRDAGPGPFELLNARKLVEGEIAALAAVGATADDIEALAAERRAHGRRMSTTSRFARTATANSTFGWPRRPPTVRWNLSWKACGTSVPNCGAVCSTTSIPPTWRSRRSVTMPRSSAPLRRMTRPARGLRCIGTCRG